MNRILFLLLFLITISSFSQKKKYVILQCNSCKLKTVLRELENNFDIVFSYPSNLIEDTKITLTPKKQNLDDFLFEISNQTNFDFTKIDSKYIYITKKQIQNLKEVIIHNYLTKGIQKNKDASFNMSLKKLGVLAGLTEADVLESIQQLPGVISDNETATQLSVRGGTADQNHVIWDDIPIYHSGHLFGLVSVFNPNVAEKVQFISQGTNPKYGDRISSVIAINTKDKIKNNSNAEIGLNAISADAIVHFPILKNKMDIQFSFRRSFEDIIESTTFIKLEEKAFQNTHIDDEFFYFKDYNVKWNYAPNKKNHFGISYIHIDNDLETDYHTDNETIINNDRLDTENDGYNLSWKHQWKYNLTQKTSVSLSDFRFDYDNYKTVDTDFLSDFSKKNYIKETSFYTEIDKHFDKSKLTFGYEYNKKMVDFKIQNKKDILYILGEDNATLERHAIYSNYFFSVNNYTFNLGLRTNYYQQLNTFKIAPRFIILKEVNEHLKVQITGEIKNQTIKQIEPSILSDLTLEDKIWRLVDGEKHPIITANQLTFGASYTKNNWLIDVNLYHKYVKGISALTLGYLNPLNSEVHIGKQKGLGATVFIKKHFNNFNIWISYSYLDIENKYDGINNNQYFKANTDINHSLTTTLNYKYKNLKMALNWRIRSGKPLTDLDYDDNNNAYFDGINTEKHPTYHRLDFSAIYPFKLSKKNKAKAGFSVKNVYNNRNYINTVFEGNNTLNDPIKVKKYYSIGFMPNIMFRVYF